jgi:hypothetical protein
MSRLGAEPQLNGDEIEQSLAIDYRKVVFIVVIEDKNGEILGGTRHAIRARRGFHVGWDDVVELCI